MEHRGHGRSGRLGQDELQVEVEDYNYYIYDFKKFIDTIVKKNNDELYLYGHSLGGTIGALFLEEYSDYFEKAVLSSPMLTMKFGNLPESLAKLFLGFPRTKEKLSSYAPSTGPYLDEFSLEKSSASSRERYEYYYHYLAVYKDIQMGGPSIHWVKEALLMTKVASKKEKIKKVQIPVLLFQADNDNYVKKRGQKKFEKYSKNTTLIFVPESKHELYREKDPILFKYLNTIMDFYKN